MPKYEQYFVNKDDVVCKHVTYKITLISNLYLRSFKPFKHFFKLMLISYLTYEILYS